MNGIEENRLMNIMTFDTEEQAFQLLTAMNAIFETYGVVTVADVHNLCDSECGNYIDDKYGWVSMGGFIVEYNETTGKYYIDFPTPRLVYDETTGDTEDPMVEHPNHYKTESGLETITVIEAFTDGLEGIEAVDTGNVIKYICRWKKKNGLQDLKKARWYLNHLIDHIEKEIE